MWMLVLLALLLLAVPAHADVMYSYQGNPFPHVTGEYTTAMHLQASFAVPEPLVRPVNYVGGTFAVLDTIVMSYSFSDGVQTLTQENSTVHLTVGWPASVDTFSSWGITATGTTGLINMIFGYPDGQDLAETSTGQALGIFGIAPVGYRSAPGTWTAQTVSVPELAILPRLPRVLKVGLGLGLEAKITTVLQRATAWTAAAILRAPRDGVTIRMPSVSVEVAEACSGLQTLLLMVGAAGLIAAARYPGTQAPRNPACKPAILLACYLSIFLAAVLLALEANALRVAGIALGLEYVGAMTREAKDWIQIGTTGLALAQLVGVGRLVRRV